MKQLLIVLYLLMGARAFAQGKEASDFVLDESKPYVYLQFDHIGPRKPLQKGEGDTGLWIKVVNNCHLPIVFRGVNASHGEGGFKLEEEVVEMPPPFRIVFTPQEEKEAEIQSKLRLQKLKHKPEGYWSETWGGIRVQPGEEILFSVPLNHVDEDWYLRVKFTLVLNGSWHEIGPFTYLPFTLYDVPKKDRPSK